MPDFASLNATQSVTASIGSSAGLSAVVGIIAILGICLVIGLLATSLERYKTFWKYLTAFLGSFMYTTVGGVAAMSIYGIYVVVTTLVTFGSGFDPIWIGYGIVGYIILTAMGYVVMAVIKRLGEYHKETTGGIKDNATK